jgi:hypothetical protein
LTPHRPTQVSEDSKGRRGVPESYDEFGAAHAAGDFDHDGTDDLAAGGPGAGPASCRSSTAAAGAA